MKFSVNMKKNSSPSRIIFIAAVFALLTIYIILWGQMIFNVEQRTGTDFIAFYTAGRVANDHGIKKTYSVELQQAIQEDILGFEIKNSQPLLYNHLPFLVPILMLISKVPYVLAFIIWTILQVLFWGSGFYLLEKETNNTRLIIGASLFFPIFISLLIGQDTAIFFLGIILIAIGLKEKKTFLISIGIALTMVRPQIAIPLMVTLSIMHKNQIPKLLSVSLILAIISILLIGLEGTYDFLNILSISGKGQWFGMNEAAMFNLTGLLVRSTETIKSEGIHKIAWIAYGLFIISTATWAALNKGDQQFQFYVILVLSLFFSPHLHSHDLSVLIIPMLILIKTEYFSMDVEKRPFILLGISFLLIITNNTQIQYFFVYLLMISILFLISVISPIKKKAKSYPFPLVFWLYCVFCIA